MANNLAQAVAYARATPLRDGKTWSGWCASFNYRAGDFSTPYPTATAAGTAAGVLSGSQPAPAGAQHYWSGVGGDGHCSIELGGGLQLMASSAVTDRWGVDMGTIMLADYNRARPAAIYRGWSMNWGSRDRLAGTATISPGPPNERNKTMGLVQNSDKGTDWYIWGIGGVLHVGNPEHLDAIKAVWAGRATFRQIKLAETYFYTLCHGYPTKLLS